MPEATLEEPAPEAPELWATQSLLPHQVRESAQEMEESKRMTLQVVGINKAEQAKQKVIYSYNLIDLTKPPLPFENEFNLHPLNPTRVMSMRNALLSEGFCVFVQENQIMILIGPTSVDPSCIMMDPHGEPKPLVLNNLCLLKVFSIIGSQHRREAIIYIKKEYQKKLNNIVAVIEKKKSRWSHLKS